MIILVNYKNLTTKKHFSMENLQKFILSSSSNLFVLIVPKVLFYKDIKD
jgi:hypothetical protein